MAGRRAARAGLAAAVGALALATAAAAPPAETLRSTDQLATADGLVADREALPGARLWKRACADCHMGGVARAPHLQWLEMMPPAAIVRALTTGVMAEQGRDLTAAERLALAEYVTRRPLPDGLPPEAHAPRCTSPNPLRRWKAPVPRVGWGHDARRFAAGGGLVAADLPRLELKWAYVFPNATRARSQPAIAAGTVFVGGEDGRVMALDLATGCERWAFQASAEVRTGIVLGEGPGGRRFAWFGDILGRLYALDARTGRLLWAERMDDHPSATLTATPLLHGRTLFVPVSSLEVVPAADPGYPCCTFRGSTVAVDAWTGRELWRFHPIPEPPRQRGVTAAGTPVFGPSGAPMWVSPTIDPLGQTLFLGSGQNYSSPADGNSNAIFAVDVATGVRRWQRQTVPRDAWNVACMMAGNPNCPEERGPDLDHSASILPVTLGDGRTILVAGHKTGQVFGLDPADGRVLWATRVGRGSIQGGVHFGLAVEGSTVYVPINDMNNTRNGEALDPAAARPGMHALDAATGRLLWSSVTENRCGADRPFCDPGISAAVTAIPGAVIAGHLDGVIRAYAREDGRLLFTHDTRREVEGVNGIRGRGGSMSGPGAAVGEGHLVINSGYGLYFHEPGNVLLVFAPGRG